MSKLLWTLCFLATASSNIYARDVSAPVAECGQLKRDVACSIKWDFVLTPREQYQLQNWDGLKGRWVDVPGAVKVDAAPASTATVAPGKLYRVFACNSGGKDCLSSTAVWAPIWLAVADIPEFVPIKRSKADSLVDPNFPKSYQVAKSKARSTQLTQYNLYLLVNELAAIDSYDKAKQMPPMRAPNYMITSEGPQTLEESVAYNVYSTYESFRRQRLDNFRLSRAE
jgi:hypothetical protein